MKLPDDVDTLDAARVRLRRITPDDAQALFGVFSDPEVMRYWSRPAMTAIAEAEKLVGDILADYASGEALPLAIARTSDGVLLGNCTLFHFHEASRRAEIGYALARPFWGHGYMHEALQALVGFAFGCLDLNRLEADIDPRNAASGRALDRLGFVAEGLLRQRWIVNGEVSDSRVYGLLRGDWRGLPFGE